MAKMYSECPSEHCSAAQPRIFKHNFDSLPPEVQEAFIEREYDKYSIKRCGYCGDIWVEYYDATYHQMRKDIIGIDNHVAPGGGMIWKILEWKRPKKDSALDV